MGISRLMSVRCEESRWPKSVVNGFAGMGSGRRGKLREVEARVFFRPSNRLIPYGLAETPGMPGDAPVGPGMPPGMPPLVRFARFARWGVRRSGMPPLVAPLICCYLCAVAV